MIVALFWVGIIAVLIGIILNYVEAGGKVSASTQFGDFSGAVGLVALIIGIVLMAISALA